MGIFFIWCKIIILDGYDVFFFLILFLLKFIKFGLSVANYQQVFFHFYFGLVLDYPWPGY